MADDMSTNDATDTSVDESVDTSTNEEAPDTDDVALEDMEISDDEVEDTEESEESEGEAPASESSDETEEESAGDDTASDDAGNEAEDDTEAQKRRNAEYAQQRIAERAERQRQREVQEATENVRLEQYLKEAEGDEAELTIRQAEVERLLLQREKVTMNEERLRLGIDRAIGSIDLFRTGSPEVKEELTNAVDDFIAMHVQLDNNGNPVAINGDISEFLQKKADSIRRIQGVGVRQAVKDKQATKARTVTVPSRTPKEPKVDSDLKDFDDGWN